MGDMELKDLTGRLVAELKKFQDEEYKIQTRVFIKFRYGNLKFRKTLG